jgi:hypothetical protein
VPTSFARDIRPLFRDSDIAEMRFAFDLSDYEDVKDNAEAIHERLSKGSMPCDGPWPEAQVARFRQWMEEAAQSVCRWKPPCSSSCS